MTPKRSKYTTEFKAQAIKKIAKNNGNITQTAKELGIPMNCSGQVKLDSQ